MKYEPNVIQATCPRCKREHSTFIQQIDEQFFGICENCLDPKERLEMVKIIRRVLSVKYGNDITKITNVVENQQTTEELVAEPPKVEVPVPLPQEEPPQEPPPPEEPPKEDILPS